MPLPEMVQDVSSFEGYSGVAFWEREDALLLHPPQHDAISAICRGIKVSAVVQASAAVHAARGDGPLIGFAIGISEAGTVTRDNWLECVGPMVHVAPGAWGVVRTAFNDSPLGETCDVVLVTQVAGNLSNDNAWALFRRFSFLVSQD